MAESLRHGKRKFYDIPDHPAQEEQEETPSLSLFSYINSNVIGNAKSFIGPFGARKTLYCDYTASGRSLSFIEDFIRDHVLPVYGNTHTTSTVTSLQTTLFRHEARDIVRNAVNASEHDAVIFTGSGCTAAVHKLKAALDLTQPPVVFCGPHEHHSNLLPWREIESTVINICETSDGKVDLKHLKHELEVWQSAGRPLIGCFAAASNVTGVLSDVDETSALLHRHGALAVWDYATAGPYVKIDMNPVVTNEDQAYVYKDAVFMSVHKFVGGVQTPGILVAKKQLFRNPVPTGCGGGSVFFVRKDAHRYLQEAEMREEGGTPAIVESIRAGLVFQLKEAVGADTIMTREHYLCQKAFEFFKPIPNLVVLGPTQTVPRLPVFSFLIRHPDTGLFLHHNYVCALLNDLFGIQSRGGCACAGPYAQTLLGIDEPLAVEIEKLLLEDGRLDRVHLRRYREYSERESLRPGFVRFNLPYFMDDDSVEFVLEAIKLVAEYGWKLLPQYNYNPETGEWRHRTNQVFTDRKWLGFLSYNTGSMQYNMPRYQDKGPAPETLQDCLDAALDIFERAKRTKQHMSDQTLMFDGDSQRLRWFLLPSEAYSCLHSKVSTAKQRGKLPFEPTIYPKQVDDTGSWSKRLSDSERIATSHVESRRMAGTKLQQRKTQENDNTSEINTNFKEGFMNYLLSNFTETDTKQAEHSKEILTDVSGKEECRLGQLCSTDSSSLQVNGSNGELTDDVLPENENDKAAEKATTVDVNGSDSKKQSQETHGENLDNLQNSTSSSFMASTLLSAGDGTSAIQSSGATDNKNVTADDKIDVHLSGDQRASPCTDGTNGVCLSGRCDRKKNDGQTVTPKWQPPPKHILKLSCEAIDEYKMIEGGDKVLVCLSGGKDSLSLLHTLRQYQFVVGKRGIHFDLGAVTIDPQTESYDPSPLKGYLAQLELPYFYEEQNIMEAAKSLPYECASICSYCSRMKRGRIYTAARREGYNVLAMGQHLDDLAESFLMSLFHNGVVRTMKACYTVGEGDLRVIRPFVYVREKDLRTFAEEKKLPVIAENCPACFEAPKERHRMKQLLASQEILHPRLFHSLRAGLKPIMAINKTGVNVTTLLAAMGKESPQENDSN